MATVMPLKFGYRMFDLRPFEIVDAYYGASLAILAIYQAVFTLPLKSFRVGSWKAYGIGTILLAVFIWVWTWRSEGRVISFANLQEGAVFSPAVLAFVFALVHAAAHLLGTNSVGKHTQVDT